MSTLPPTPRRRRIAGERRVARPGETAVEPEPQLAPEPESETETKPEPKPEPKRRRGAVRRPRPAPRATGWWGSRASVVVLACALAALVTLVTLLALGRLGNRGISDIEEAEAVDKAAATAPAAAESAAAAILSYDYRTIEADGKVAVKYMTSDFAERYQETLEKVVGPTARDSQARVSATVHGSAVIRASEDRVRVLVFVDQTSLTRGSEGPRQQLNRVEMIMVKQGDAWLADEVTAY